MSETNSDNVKTNEFLPELMKGDTRAFTAIYLSYFSKLYRFTQSIVCDKEATEEIIQDVFVSLWTKRESLPQMKSLLAYLFGMVRYKVVDYIRHSKVKKRYEEHYRLFEAVYDSTDERAVEHLIDLIEKRIEELPPRCKQAILLRLKENLSYKDIAARMNTTRKTVENQITKAFEYLRALKTETKIRMLFLEIACITFYIV